MFRLQHDLHETERQLNKMKADNKRNIDSLKISNERLEGRDHSMQSLEELNRTTAELAIKISENSQLTQERKIMAEHISLLERKCEETEMLPDIGSMAGSYMRQKDIEVQSGEVLATARRFSSSAG